MVAVGELVLVLGLLVSAHCEVRARDPDVEEEEEEERGGRAAVGGVPPYLQRLHPRVTEPPLLGHRENYPTRSGYKLSTRPLYKQKQKIFTDVLWRCCPGHGGKNCEDTVPDAQLDSGSSAVIGGSEPRRSPEELRDAGVHASLQQQHGDPNREQNDHQGPVGELQDASYPNNNNPNNTSTTHPTPDPGHAHVPPHTSHRPSADPQDHVPPHTSHRPSADPQDHVLPRTSHRPSADPQDHDSYHTSHHPSADPQDHVLPRTSHHPSADPQDHVLPRTSHHPSADPQDHDHHPHHRSHRPADTHDHHRQREPPLTVVDKVGAASSTHTMATTVLSAPDMMALVFSQLDPILKGFNRSLEHLSRQVGDLARDVAQLKISQQGAELRTEPPGVLERDVAVEERLDAKLDEVFEDIREVWRQMEGQRTDMENRLHSQHAMLHYNLTSFKADVDMKLKRHQKMLQVNLQTMNATLSELKLDQDQIPEDPLEVHLPPPSLPQPLDSSALWEAIERLDNMVVNNTVKVGGLMEDVEVTSGGVQQLKRDTKELREQISQTARNGQIQFMETGLEVEAAKEAVLGRVGELAGNLSQQGQRMQEMDVDVDYLYTALYKHNSSTDCECAALKAAVTRLERGVANVTELANENRLALDETDGGGAGQWGGASDWEPAVEALQRGLQQVKESLASEQSRTRTLEHSLTQLSDSVSVLKEADGKLKEEMRRLAGSFQSLLKDVIRHSDVLELLLGEEVLEFLEWSVQDQEAHSISALKEQLTLLQEQLRRHDESIASLQGDGTGDREEVPSADQPSSWYPDSMRRSGDGAPARERQLLLHPERRLPHPGGDGGDLWNLEKTVEELGLKVLRLEEKPCPAACNTTAERAAPPGGEEAKLQAEVTWLKRGLEDHLRMFKNVFSNADVLAGAGATLELDKLWHLVKNKDGKKEKKRGGAREESGRGNHRTRRDLTGVPVLSGLSDASLLFIAGSPRSVSHGDISFEAFLNRGQFDADAGAFTAPVDGIYLFVLTLDLRPGPAHISLRREGGGAQVSLQRQQVTEAGPVTAVSLLLLREGEELRLHLRGGAWAESEDNVFAGLLLHRAT
ncbi:multimerin-2a isoform X3 [Thunnus thynnus]|uniref:multimerin-2a isoform X3 n=1 Tax=Thunnus thynnus TaxID=8237 RepID=UPI0035290C2A